MAKSPAAILADMAGRLGSIDPFGRLRMSSPTSLFDSKQVYDDNPLFFVNETALGGTTSYVNNRSATELLVTSTIGSKTIRQTKKYFNYQPGKGLLIDFSTAFEGSESGIERRAGYFDSANGAYIKQVAGAFSVVLRSTVGGVFAENIKPSALWNLDKMDGSGPSKVTLNAGTSQLGFIDLQWLGIGVVAVGFSIGGLNHYVHIFNSHSNVTGDVYMQTPNLPVRWEIENTASGVGAKMTAICCSVMVEGSVDPLGFTRSADMEVAGKAITNTLSPLVGIRLKASHNRATTILKRMSVMASTGANFRWAIILNPTITGGSGASWVAINDSAVEKDVASDGPVTGGHLLDSGYSSDNSDLAVADIKSILSLASDFAGVSDKIYLCAQKVGASSETIFGAMTWLEAS